MQLEREWLEDLIFGEPLQGDSGKGSSTPPSGEASRRFTQDSPVLPDVWIEYGLRYCQEKDPDAPVDLLLTPHRKFTTAELARHVMETLKVERASAGWRKRHSGEPVPARIACNQSAVAACLHFDELLRVLLPLTQWWKDRVQPHIERWEEEKRAEMRRQVQEGMERAAKGQTPVADWAADLLWMIRVVGVILLAREAKPPRGRKGAPPPDVMARKEVFEDIVRDKKRQTEIVLALMQPWPTAAAEHSLWLVSRNREARTTVWRSTLAVKADAARSLFNINCSKLAWAIIDSGIDARHPAFRQRENDALDGALKPLPEGDWSRATRVDATFDFTIVRDLLSPDPDAPLPAPLAAAPDAKELKEHAKELRRGLQSGRTLDWGRLAPLLKVKHDQGYRRGRPLSHAHGTHVAGILAGNWRASEGAEDEDREQDLVGVCPDLHLYDLQVLGDDGTGDEFSVMAALQFIRHLNGHREQPVIHGVNLSLSIPHDVANYACGRTPVCEECERVVASGVVVVAAAGNDGYMQYVTPRGSVQGYRSISISDPGNAEEVITVGATHRYQPHTYGVSYFSSRGPTGDGRLKPDLVAPGEKIKAPIPGGKSETKDGTSMAAPHVSGAAALLMARHRELLGRPRQVKQILCDTATDLHRERYFQGSGMVDILRALQSV